MKQLWNEKHGSSPRLPWVMRQTWSNILFAHFPIKREVLEKLVPKALALDTYQGVGWVSIVPVHMSHVRGRNLPSVPGLSRYPGYNIRTYVTVNGKPGVYFFRLDAANWPAVMLARTFYRLPYYNANINMKSQGDFINFRSKGPDLSFSCRYKPMNVPARAEKGSLDEWLVERYSLYTLSKKGEPLRCDILHEPWFIQSAEVEIHPEPILSYLQIEAESMDPIFHFSKRKDVCMWPLTPVFNS